MYLVDEEEIENIYNQIKDLTAYSFEGKTIIDPALDVGDKIIIDGKPVIYQGEADFQTRFIAEISSKISIKQKQETTVKTTSQKVINRRVQSRIDEAEGKITQLVEENSEQSQKLTEVEQTVDGITQTVSNVETKVEQVESKTDTAQNTANEATEKAENAQTIANNANTSAQEAQEAVEEVRGQTIYQVDVMYALSSSSAQAPTTGWQTIAPEWEEGKYMWQKTVTTYGDGTKKESSATCITGAKGQNGENGTDGEKGDTGTGVTSIIEEYYLSTSSTSQIGGTWKTTQDTWTSGKFIWTRNKITWTNNTVTYTEPILATGLNNANSVANEANTTAITANDTANTAKNTADGVNQNLEENYYTKTETNSAIEQKADSITSSVTQEISTAKAEAIDSANSTTDSKLQDYTKTTQLGTFIEQNYEYIKYAWNQISQYLQFEGINGKATLNIYDENNNMLMSLSQDGQTFYDNSGNKIGTVGIIREDDKDTLAFAMNVDWENVTESKSMAWGFFDKNGKFLPIFNLLSYYGQDTSEYGGELSVAGKLGVGEEIRLELGGILFGAEGTESTLDGHNGNLIFTNNGETIAYIGKAMLLLGEYISGYKNEAGGVTISTGSIVSESLDTTNVYATNVLATYGSFDNIPRSDNVYSFSGSTSFLSAYYKNGTSIYLYANSSDKNLKKNIKDSTKEALEKIRQIKHREFDWKADDKHQEIGYIAQEMEQIDETFVHHLKYKNQNNEEKEDWQINTLSVLATATKAIQELQQQLEELQEKDKQKDNMIENLIARIEKLEKGANNE